MSYLYINQMSRDASAAVMISFPKADILLNTVEHLNYVIDDS